MEEEKNTDNKITILFGAGAEKALGMPIGEDFAKKVLGLKSGEITMNEEIDDMNEEIDDFYRNQLNSISSECKKAWYPKYNKYSHYTKDSLLKACFKKLKLENNEEFDENNIKDEIENMSPEQKQEIINSHTSYMGLIDEHFHTLIYPKSLGVQKFWNVVCCYTRAYLYLTKQMLDKISENITYTEILTNPQKMYKKWIEYAQNHEGDNYYSILKDRKNVNIITTNYTPLCEIISVNNDIAYVHGKFSWFEEPYEMKVYDILEENFVYPKDSILFPYISIQSGIKPIIEKKQLTEYSNMINYLDESSTLIIVGFKLNCDDNHINSLIRDFLETGKKVVVFNYEDTIAENIVRSALRLNEKFDNLIVVNVDKNNALNEFETYITENIGRKENQK